MNNKLRIINLIEILKRKTDENHKLKLDEIISLLEEKGIKINNRKTLYDDFKALNDLGYIVEYQNAYYLIESPFSLAEIKILSDSLNSLKNLDDKFVLNLNKKLYSFISVYEEKFLKDLSYINKHKEKYFLNRLEDCLYALNNNLAIIISRKNKEDTLIFPIFLYRENNYYYLYYHYENKDKIYHMRFDNISNIKYTDIKDNITIKKDTIIDYINASSNAFYTKKATMLKLKILDDNESIRNRIIDDFNDHIFTKDGFAIKVSINEILFSKLVAYGNKIKICDKDIANKYKEYLKEIIKINS